MDGIFLSVAFFRALVDGDESSFGNAATVQIVRRVEVDDYVFPRNMMRYRSRGGRTIWSFRPSKQSEVFRKMCSGISQLLLPLLVPGTVSLAEIRERP